MMTSEHSLELASQSIVLACGRANDLPLFVNLDESESTVVETKGKKIVGNFVGVTASGLDHAPRPSLPP